MATTGKGEGMRYIDVSTQAELDAVLARGDANARARCIGAGYFVARGSSHVVAWESSHVEAWESSHVVAWGSSHVEARESSHVEAWESSHVVAWGSSHVEARGSSHVVAWESSHVVAWGSSHVEARESSHVVAWGSSHVEAWGSSHVEARGSSHVVARESSHVVARESSHVVARESSHVVASSFAAVHRHSSASVVLGGTIIEVRQPVTVIEWCAFYGVPVVDNRLVVYKAVRGDYRSAHGTLYTPGRTAEAPDWDGGIKECGGGLHFSPHPMLALDFDKEATRFVACTLALEDVRAPHSGDIYPHKIKARRVCGPIVEVDRYGTPITQEQP